MTQKSGGSVKIKSIELSFTFSKSDKASVLKSCMRF